MNRRRGRLHLSFQEPELRPHERACSLLTADQSTHIAEMREQWQLSVSSFGNFRGFTYVESEPEERPSRREKFREKLLAETWKHFTNLLILSHSC
jgi:hypothetical protein